MSIIKAIIMGVVQGLTEFLPVSSSGHLAIFRNILGLNLEGGILFEVMLHFGTLVAIFIAYFKDIKELFIEGIGIVIDFFKWIKIVLNNIFTKNKKKYNKIINTEYRKFVMLIIVASIPTAVLGLYLEEIIEGAYTALLIPGICLLITGALLLTTTKIKKGSKKAGSTKYTDSFIIGLFQGFATMPGISRSGSTLVAGMILGLEREFAVKFSFIMSIPAVIGATLYKLKDVTSDMMTTSAVLPYMVGMLVSAAVGYICIITLLKVVKKNKLHYFSYYCFIVGLLAIIGHFVN